MKLFVLKTINRLYLQNFGSNCPLVSEQEIFLHELSNGHGLLVSEKNSFFHHQMAMVH